MPRELAQCRVHESGSLLDAMWALDRGAAGVALVVDGRERLVGLVTDGDVRRALLKGFAVESALLPHVRRDLTSVAPGTGRAEVLDLMQARTIDQIPIVDADGLLVGLHLLHDVMVSRERPNWAVIMAGGRGSRLGALTDDVPKPMLRVAGRPILERLVLHLVGHGIREVFLAINYLGHVVEQHFGDGSALGCRIHYLREEHPLGTGGALALLPEVPRHPVVALNGDLVTRADVAAMLDFHERSGAHATVATRRYFHTIPFGAVELEGMRVTGLEEKPRVSWTVNAGIYVLQPEAVRQVPRDRAVDLPVLLAGYLREGRTVHGFEIEGDWIDVGRPEQLREAAEGRG
jgi:dTDP-glucose pyrophosphorylase